MKISENTSISMPARNLISIVTACIVGAWFGFGVIERLNIIETELQLMNQDLLEASTQKPVDMEQFMLLEFISKEHTKLKEDVEISFDNDPDNEFDCFKWVSYWYPLNVIISFKEKVYREALNKLKYSFCKEFNNV